MWKPRENLVGQTRGTLKIVRDLGSDQERGWLWLCVCKCGRVVSLNTNALKKGRKTCSPGCPLGRTPGKKQLTLNLNWKTWVKGDEYQGCVYVMKAVNLYKIGLTYDLIQRLRDLTAANPFIELVYDIRVDKPENLERELHSHFAHKRRAGEWFELTDEDIDFIRAL